MSLSPRQKFAWVLIVFVVVGIAIGVFEAETDIYELKWVFFAWIGIGSVCLMQIRCPNCATPVVYQGKLGRISIYAGFVRRKCQNCGYDLTTLVDEGR